MSVTDHELIEIIKVTHTGMTTDEFAEIVRAWIATAKHPRTGRLYTQMVYQPMLELLTYLRGHGFKTFIVSAGGVEFMRVWADQVYGVPTDQVVGTTFKTSYELWGTTPVIVRQPKVDFVDDGPGKPIGINKFIGKRPVMAFGNADGDFQMLQWTTAGSGARLDCWSTHTDGVREYDYDHAVRGRAPGQGAGGGTALRLDRGEHEGRLGEDLSQGP